MTLLKHKKSGGLYRERLRRVARAPLYAGEEVIVDLGTQNEIKCLVTDDISPLEYFVAYTRDADHRSFARPARLFDDGRFEVVPPVSLP